MNSIAVRDIVYTAEEQVLYVTMCVSQLQMFCGGAQDGIFV